MATNALVLGGGGTVGVAWELGLMIGLQAQGFDSRKLELILGTSAGSFIGAMLLTRGDLVSYASSLLEKGSGAAEESTPAGGDSPSPAMPDPISLAEIFRIWTQAEVLDQPTRQQIGALARDIVAAPESALDAWLSQIDQGHGWPDRLRVTAVDTASGDFEIFDAGSGIPLIKAVAASCAVPGIFSPITIGDRRYMDGGVRSGTSADTLITDGVSEVLIVAPLSDAEGTGIAKLMERCSRDEVAQLEKRGVAVHIIQPNDADRTAFGPNMMDSERQGPAFAAGNQRGLAEAAKIAEKLPSLA